MRHVVDHHFHIFFAGPDKGRSENNRQILCVHFVELGMLHDLLQMEHQMLKCEIMMRRQILNYTLQRLQSQLRIGDFVRLDKAGIGSIGQERVRELPEKRFQQTADHVDIVPLRVNLWNLIVAFIDFFS